MGKPALADIALMADALREIATAIGCPADADPLTDLDGLVMMVQRLAQIAESRDLAAIIAEERADAVAADRVAAGAWLRSSVPSAPFARSIEHGDHIDDDAPPLPSLRMTLLLRDELLRQVETLTAERDRRIEPVEHARAVMRAYLLVAGGLMWRWARSPAREELLARVGADVLAEVER